MPAYLQKSFDENKTNRVVRTENTDKIDCNIGSTNFHNSQSVLTMLIK